MVAIGADVSLWPHSPAGLACVRCACFEMAERDGIWPGGEVTVRLLTSVPNVRCRDHYRYQHAINTHTYAWLSLCFADCTLERQSRNGLRWQHPAAGWRAHVGLPNSAAGTRRFIQCSCKGGCAQEGHTTLAIRQGLPASSWLLHQHVVGFFSSS
jgi:hypothetical protein